MASMRRPVLLSERSSIVIVQQSILSFSRTTWKRSARLSTLFFVIFLIVMLVFYFRAYVPSLKEEPFEQQANCTIVLIRSNSQVCKNSQSAVMCQLIIGQCSDGRNRSLYQGWLEYEKFSYQCTVDPCTGSSVTTFSVNQSAVSVYISSQFDQGYLQRTAKLAYGVAKTIFYVLVVLVIVTCILALVLLFVLHIHKNDGKIIQPVQSITETSSVYGRAPSILIQKAPITNKEEQHPTHAPVSLAMSTDSNNTLVIPMETTSAPAEPRSQPLNPAALGAPVRNENDILLVQNSIL